MKYSFQLASSMQGFLFWGWLKQNLQKVFSLFRKSWLNYSDEEMFVG